ncbi:uncharacterized protein LOC109285591 [Alligator mississippiensis]|uniref:uncharacterized protein LOC109285591 n=1 Tax=Alligator mississippiensis TaxID=8496 RepID=UPI0028775771|nr:uncharacterized protein LOC109285591 [Alligator mississippiensis]
MEQCEVCKEYSGKQLKERLNPHDIPSWLWEKVGIDLFNVNDRNYMVTIDYYSFGDVDYLEDTQARTVIRKLNAHFAWHGIPDILFSDNGPQYTSREFKQFCTKWKFQHKTLSPGYPQSNGKAESVVKTAKRPCGRKDVTLCMDFRGKSSSKEESEGGTGREGEETGRGGELGSLGQNSRPCNNSTDASEWALGAVLSPEIEGAFEPVAYTSQKLNPQERRYATIERECLAIKWGIQYFWYYLLGWEFTLITDHAPLRWLRVKWTMRALPSGLWPCKLLISRSRTGQEKLIQWLIFFQDAMRVKTEQILWRQLSKSSDQGRGSAWEVKRSGSLERLYS